MDNNIQENNERKYAILKDDQFTLITRYGQKLYRILALKDIVDENGNVLVHSGDLGGYVSDEHNLSQEGTCWIYDEAVACDRSRVSGNAQIRDNATVKDIAKVFGNATVKDHAIIWIAGSVSDNAVVGGYSQVTGIICDNVEVLDESYIWGDFKVGGNVKILGKTSMGSPNGRHKEICGNDCYKDGEIVQEGSPDNDGLNGPLK